MTHGAIALGRSRFTITVAFHSKDERFGEKLSQTGRAPAFDSKTPAPSNEEKRQQRSAEFLIHPLGNLAAGKRVACFRSEAGKRRLEVGLPDKDEDPGKPDKGLSPRGFGSSNRTDPVFLGLQKTRLLDPTLNFLGTNDHPGDFRRQVVPPVRDLRERSRSVAFSVLLRSRKHGPLANS